MTNRLMMSVAAAALLAGAGFANAQGTGNREQPSAGSGAQQSAPSSERGNSAAQSKPSSDMKATQSEEKAPGAAKNQRADDKAQGSKSKSMSSENESKGSKDMKAESGKDMKAGGNKMNAEQQKGATDSKSTDSKSTTTQTGQSAPQKGQTTTQSQTGQSTTQSGQSTQSGTSVQSQTTGQAGAAARLSTEQRTQITTVIRNQHVQPLQNVNFSIAVGTRVPRDVRFHPLPREVISIYPEWRGYEFVLVNNQILVIDPRTFEIVAILDA